MKAASVMCRSCMVLAFVVATGRALGAQQPAPPLTPLDAPPRASSMVLHIDSVPSALANVPVESLLLRPGTFTYQLSTRRDTLVTPLGQRTVVVSETTFAGSPAWLIAESRSGTAVATSDSLYLVRADLSPTRWMATNGKSQLAASFGRDSMFVALQSYQGRTSLVTPLPAGALLTPGMVERIIELMPLAVGFRTGATIVLFDMSGPRASPAELRVDREEQLVLPDRTVDCWVVVLHGGTFEERLWVARDSSRVVKTEQQTGVGVLTAVLTP